MPANMDASFISSLPPNVAVQFLDRVAKSGSSEAFRYPKGDGWESVTWKQAGDEVARMAGGLLALGIEPEQRVGIASGTRYEWILADLGIMCAGAATTTVYPSTNEEDTAYILADSECRVVFAEDDEQIAKLTARKSELPHVAKVVTFDGTADGDWVIDLKTLESLGEEYLAAHPGIIEQTAESISGDQLATLIYTSGTTGRPKGVRLRHSSWVYEGEAIRARNILSESDLEFRWLPMAHSFGKVLMSTQMACGFSAAIDGRVDKIIENLARREADLHGRRAAHLREGPRPDRHDAGGGGRRQGEDLQQGLRGRPQGRQAQARGQVGADAPRPAAHGLRQAGLQQDPGPLRWPGALLHLRVPRPSTATSPSGSTPPAS